MEPTTIFLLVGVFVLLYVAYYYYTHNASLMMNTVSPANTAITLTPPIPASGSMPNSFTFSIWVNINDWNVGYESFKNLITLTTLNESSSSVIINLDNHVNKITVAVKTTTSTTSSTTSSTTTNVITTIENIPIQKWIHLTFSLQGNTLDTYMNGKLIQTSVINGVYAPPTNPQIILGGGAPNPLCTATSPSNCFSATNASTTGFSGWITQFQYFPTGLDPQTVWDIFQKGNGTSMLSNFFGNYGLDISLTNNGVKQNTISI